MIAIDDTQLKIRKAADDLCASLSAINPGRSYEVQKRHQDGEFYVNPAWLVVEKTQVNVRGFIDKVLYIVFGRPMRRTNRRTVAIIDCWRWGSKSLCMVFDQQTAKIAALSLESAEAVGGVTVLEPRESP